jgi:HlyD family secretion protein
MNGTNLLVETPLVAPRPNGVQPPAPPRRLRRRLVLWAALALIVLAAAAVAIVLARGRRSVVYQTAPAAHRSLVQAVTATGTVNPQDTISVGSQVSGTLIALAADYNSRVHRGQVLARIDPTSFQAAVDQARAALAQSESQLAAALGGLAGASATARGALATVSAGAAPARSAAATAAAQQAAIAGADADVAKAANALALADTTLARDRRLLAQGFIARSQFDADASALVAARSAYAGARVAASQARSQAAAGTASAQSSQAQNEAQRFAGLTAAEQRATSEAQADAQRAAIAIQRAQLSEAEINLGHTVIASPVDGTVVARNVSVGQTVAASFQTPTLFTIARDLHKMEVDIAVGEPDVGTVRAGQIMKFTVLAYPARTFQGTVTMVRQNPTTVQNVVTYTAVAYVDNRAGLLRPGMTANASIDVARAAGGIVVPLQALTYVPPSEPGAKYGKARGSAPGSVWGATATTGTTGASLSAGARARLYVLSDGRPVGIPVRVLLVAGTDASVASEGAPIAEDAPVVVADSTVTTRAATASAPFNTGMRGIR